MMLLLLSNKGQQNQMQQPQKQQNVDIQSVSLNYRKITLNGSSVVASFRTTNEKLFPKEYQFQMSIKEIKEERLPVTIKVVEEDYYKKYKLQSGIKSLLKAYEENRKRNSSQGMNKLGLDVIKIKSFSNNPKKTNLIHSNKSMRKISNNNLKNSSKKIQANHQLLSPLKHMIQQKIDQNQDLIFSTKQIRNTFSYRQYKHVPHILEDPVSRDQFYEQEDKINEKRYKKQRKVQEYLYKRLQGTENRLREEQNVVYDKRIKSYLDFLWKNQFSHNIYINLDLKVEENIKSKRLKAYISLGNNGAMVKGLLKRRFWWNFVDERTGDCDFVWTQVKVNQIFNHQKRSSPNRPRLKNQYEDDQDHRSSPTSKLKLFKLKNQLQEESLPKILNKNDLQTYKSYKCKYENTYSKKDRQYSYKYQKINKHLSTTISEPHHPIHNHLQHNFYLGNKKALFYNLRQYYSLMREDVYQYIPLTFHIKMAMKDTEYLKFLDYYKKRAKVIEKEKKELAEQGRGKTRNIWIVKPGQNSNQGRGITVIDQIYELNSILKQTQKIQKPPLNNQSPNKEQTQHTYIVQMYIDRPMLYNNRKFDIRHYMLISNFYGITRAYWYEQGYIRTASYQFDINNFEPEIHLTNDAVQKKFPDYHKYEPYNKVSYEEFQRYLDINHHGKKYSFREQILPQMRKMATDAVRSVYTKISPRNLMNNFEIFGLDFMIDKAFKPWLIEINTNPCLECACPLLNKIIPYMVQQSFKLTLDLAFPPPFHYPNTSKHYAPLIALQTFKYELIFDSQISGEQLQKLYRRVKHTNLIEQIGQIQEDQEFKDNGKECKLDDFT